MTPLFAVAATPYGRSTLCGQLRVPLVGIFRAVCYSNSELQQHRTTHRRNRIARARRARHWSLCSIEHCGRRGPNSLSTDHTVAARRWHPGGGPHTNEEPVTDDGRKQARLRLCAHSPSGLALASCALCRSVQRHRTTNIGLSLAARRSPLGFGMLWTVSLLVAAPRRHLVSPRSLSLRLGAALHTCTRLMCIPSGSIVRPRPSRLFCALQEAFSTQPCCSRRPRPCS